LAFSTFFSYRIDRLDKVWYIETMKKLKRILKNKISVQFPDFRQNQSILGIWGRDQIKKLGFLGQEMILMKME